MVLNRPKWYLLCWYQKAVLVPTPFLWYQPQVPTPGTNPIFMAPTTRVAPLLLLLLLVPTAGRGSPYIRVVVGYHKMKRNNP